MVVKNVFWALFALSMVIGVHMVGFATPDEPWDEYCYCHETPCSSPDPEDLTPIDYIPCHWFTAGAGSCACTKEGIDNIYVIPDDPATRVCVKPPLFGPVVMRVSVFHERASWQDCMGACGAERSEA